MFVSSRSVWFYCVLFKFVEREAWRSDWFECVKKIAYKIPVLISKKLTYFKQMEMEIEGIIQNGFTDKVRERERERRVRRRRGRREKWERA